MNERQIKALNSLYAATIEVMEAFAPETVDADKRREALSRMIENFLISASMPDQGIIMPEIPKVGDPSNNFKHESVRNSGEDIQIFKPATPSSHKEDGFEVLETRYATRPQNYDGLIIFKQPKTKDTIFEEYCPYVLDLGEDQGDFLVEARIEEIPTDFSMSERFPDSAVKFLNEPTRDHTRIITVEKGILKRLEKKKWEILKPAKVKYE